MEELEATFLTREPETSEEFCAPAAIPVDDTGLRVAVLAIGPIVLLLLIFIYKLVERLLFWRHARRGSRIARVAASTLRQLRASRPKYHPPTRHVWCSGEDVDISSTPLLCVACCAHIAPLTPTQALNCCAACGVVAHDGCLRHVGDTCRPVATPPGPQQHFWQVAGTGRQQRLTADSQERDRVSGGVGSCLFCEDEVAEGVYAAEPAWRCACCAALTHVRCFCANHQDLPAVAAKFESKLKIAAKNGNGLLVGAAAAAVPYGSGLLGADGGFYANDGTQLDSPLAPTPKTTRLLAQETSPEGSGINLDGLGIDTAALNGAGAAVEFPPQSGMDAASPFGRKNSLDWQLSKAQVQDLDTCSLGPLQRLVVPSSCVRYAYNKDTPQHFPAIKEAQEGDGPAAAGKQTAHHPPPEPIARTDSQRSQKAAGTVPPADGIITTSTNPKESAARKRSWWRRALAPRQLQWSEWSFEAFPPQTRPLLVFVNVKSGPQVGESLHRRFLRLLHPLQVVSLPRDSPEPALRLFAFLPGVRILCVGGDGTVGWIMSCLDTLAEEKREERRKKMLENGESSGERNEAGFEEAAAAEWTPPPVAVLPLGTGNDLARCLGWGGGYGSWRQEGAPGALHAVSQASVALLDRWTLTFVEKVNASTASNGARSAAGGVQPKTPGAAVGGGVVEEEGGGGALRESAPEQQNQQPAPPSRLGGILSPRALALGSTFSTTLGQVVSSAAGGGGGTDGGGQKSKHKAKPPPEPKQKAMNNYLGIGVDAKVALEFHEMRETYPQWFQSQFGNKLVYTGVGALDIVSGGQLNLREKVVIECDEELVPLPVGAEGILIVNIPSYMGGVDLWASGAGPGAVQGTQSICDGLLEIVAVGGSWHLGRLQVGLSRAVRLRQGRRVVVRTSEALPMQVDGEPFVHPAGEVSMRLRGQSRVLRRVESKPVAKLMRSVEEALEAAAENGVITAGQHDVLSREFAARLHPQL